MTTNQTVPEQWYTEAMEELRNLRAENERLKEEWHQSELARIAAIDENERLKAVLAQYADTRNWVGNEWRGPTDNGWVLAQRAL